MNSLIAPDTFPFFVWVSAPRSGILPARMTPPRFLLVSFLSVFHAHLCAAPSLVENGQPRAEIVISDTPTRMQRVAAQELRDQIEKISGARLPIVTQPSGKVLKVFVGESDHNPVKADELRYGAYRLLTGSDWISMTGDDSDFTPRMPFARNNGDIPRAQAEWEKIVGAPYGMPGAGLYKNRLKLPGETGKPDGAITGKNEYLEIWGLDERGSFNAVCGFLHKLGARWYVPGEVGEVLPSLKTIPLRELDETVNPDFALRQFNFRFSTAGHDTSKWAMRLGIRNDEQLQIAHGMATMTNREEVFEAHPEWFALYGGKRHFIPGSTKCQLCYSNEELFQETVRYARAQIDTFQLDSVSIMPPDGYTAICQCEKCEGKDSPERNERGLLSDYVWDFANRVARELAKTHPEAKVLNCAYGVYTLPPEKIEKLEPNVLVCIVGGRRPINRGGSKGEGESAPEALRAAWSKKTDNPLLIFENYPFTDRGWYLPSFAAHALGESVNAIKGMAQGEDIWLSAGLNFDKAGIGFNHFLVYFTARMYWGGKEADVDALLREYCQLFYGPAEREMLAFFSYCEENWNLMESDKDKADVALALFAKAKGKAESGSIYDRRLDLIDDYLKGLRMKTEQLGQKRGPVPAVRLVGDAGGIVVDGKFDDVYWLNCPTAATGVFRELQTGRVATFGTSFKAGWQGDSVYFAIRCEGLPGDAPRSTTSGDDDQAIWHGDFIELQIATETHSYYQIAVSPAGHLVDLDRGASKGQWFDWDSKAEVATRIADDHWSIEIRLPVTADENDPLHQIIGRKPTQSLPWHINLCRQIIRDEGTELSALSPTGTAGFHEPMKFAHFFAGKSHSFDADPGVTDFVIAFRGAEKLLQQRQYEEALAAYLSLAGGESSDYQKSAALEQASATARALKDLGKAAELAARIPIETVRKTAQMQNLLAEQKAVELIASFGSEDLGTWPFRERGDASFVRGRAYATTRAGTEAVADYTRALAFTGDPRARKGILLALGQAQEHLLGNDTAALSAYRAIFETLSNIGGADEFAAVQATARILTRQGKYDEALNALARINTEKLSGTWRDSTLLARAGTLATAGKREEALEACRLVLSHPKTEARHRKSAEEMIGELEK